MSVRGAVDDFAKVNDRIVNVSCALVLLVFLFVCHIWRLTSELKGKLNYVEEPSGTSGRAICFGYSNQLDD